MDMDGKFPIHGKPVSNAKRILKTTTTTQKQANNDMY